MSGFPQAPSALCCCSRGTSRSPYHEDFRDPMKAGHLNEARQRTQQVLDIITHLVGQEQAEAAMYSLANSTNLDCALHGPYGSQFATVPGHPTFAPPRGFQPFDMSHNPINPAMWENMSEETYLPTNPMDQSALYQQHQTSSNFWPASPSAQDPQIGPFKADDWMFGPDYIAMQPRAEASYTQGNTEQSPLGWSTSTPSTLDSSVLPQSPSPVYGGSEADIFSPEYQGVIYAMGGPNYPPSMPDPCQSLPVYGPNEPSLFTPSPEYPGSEDGYDFFTPSSCLPGPSLGSSSPTKTVFPSTCDYLCGKSPPCVSQGSYTLRDALTPIESPTPASMDFGNLDESSTPSSPTSI
ncbi:hypothetical protein OF83DRAFT_127678 [Amylostereum chailletii]|nr:hypothetical protein OF83DRAFT_127678 [Amylostereum chailletii]